MASNCGRRRRQGCMSLFPKFFEAQYREWGPPRAALGVDRPRRGPALDRGAGVRRITRFSWPALSMASAVRASAVAVQALIAFGEPLTPPLIVGKVIVAAGVYLTNRKEIGTAKI